MFPLCKVALLVLGYPGALNPTLVHRVLGIGESFFLDCLGPGAIGNELDTVED